MKTPPTIRKKGRSEELVRSLDALDRHMAALETLAGLLKLHLEVPASTSLDPKVIGRTGLLISRELTLLRQATERVGGEGGNLSGQGFDALANDPAAKGSGSDGALR